MTVAQKLREKFSHNRHLVKHIKENVMCFTSYKDNEIIFSFADKSKIRLLADQDILNP